MINYLSNKLLLFHDGDCANIYLKDKDGNMHDYADLAKALHSKGEEKAYRLRSKLLRT